MSKEKKTERPLTLRQQRFVKAMADPDTKSQAEAARKAGYAQCWERGAGSENLAKPHIRKAVEVRKDQGSDKARDELSRFEHLLGKFSSAVDRLDPEVLDPQTIIGSLPILQKCRESEIVLREKYHVDKSGDPAALKAQGQRIQRLVVVAIRCAIERPAVASRILKRCAWLFAEESETGEPPVPAEGRWKPGGRQDGDWMSE